MASPRSLPAALLAATLMLGAPAAAEDVAAAKAMFNVGLEHLQAGRYADACPALRESYRLDPRLGTLFTLAECEARWGHAATAVAHYGNFLTQVSALPPGQRMKQQEREKIAKEQVGTLTPKIPELTLKLPPHAPPDTVVKRDGVQLRGPTLGTPLPTDPGEHVITTYVAGGRVIEQRITLKPGEKRTITLEVAPPGSAGAATQGPPDPDAELDVDAPPGPQPSVPPAAPQAPPAGEASTEGPDQGPGARRIAMYAAGGLGVAGLILGGVAGGLALAKAGETEGCVDFVCPGNQDAADAGNAARTLGWVSTVGFGVGVAGIGAAVVLLLTEPAGEPAQDAARVRAGVRAGVLAAGQDGAVLGIKGAW